MFHYMKVRLEDHQYVSRIGGLLAVVVCFFFSLIFDNLNFNYFHTQTIFKYYVLSHHTIFYNNSYEYKEIV